MNIKGAIFDLDGTLLDSMFIWDTIGADYLISRGIQPEEGLNKKFKSMSIMQAAEYYQEKYGMTDSVEEIIKGVNSMIDHLYSNTVKVKEGVIQMLEAFQKRGIKMCIATATDRYMAQAALQNNHIDSYFFRIFTCTELGVGKDSPVIFEKALNALCTGKEETLVFEDAPHAIATARNAGFHVVGVYDSSAETAQEKLKALSDYYLPNFKDWSKIIK